MPDTLFSAALRLCGLSHREAAVFFGVRPDTVKSWSAGRNSVPNGVLDGLRDLALRIDRAASRSAAMYADRAERPDTVEIGIATSDDEARSLGWPCVGAQMAMAARLWSLLPDDVTVRLVPRGSTAAAAAAAGEHDRARG